MDIVMIVGLSLLSILVISSLPLLFVLLFHTYCEIYNDIKQWFRDRK